MLITIAGCEGVGKSTATRAISDFFTERNLGFINTREPGGTPIAEQIRELLKHFETEEVFHSMTELLLFYASRYQLFKNLIIPSLNEGKAVIADRSFACTFAYQLRAANAIQEDDFWAIHNLVMKDMPQYDLIFHLYTDSVEEGLSRARGRGELDRIERNEVAFFERAAAGYHEFFKDNPNVVPINTSVHGEHAVREIVQKTLSERV